MVLPQTASKTGPLLRRKAPDCYTAAQGMKGLPSFEFHVSRAARDAYNFDQTLFTFSGNVVVGDMAACRAFAERMNRVRDAEHHPERAVHPGALNAMGLIDEVGHLVVALYQRQRDPRALLDALA